MPGAPLLDRYIRILLLPVVVPASYCPDDDAYSVLIFCRGLLELFRRFWSIPIYFCKLPMIY